MPHKDQYVNVYHSQRDVRRVWVRYFEVVDMLPGYPFTHDLVVMQRRQEQRPAAYRSRFRRTEQSAGSSAKSTRVR